MRNGQLMDYFTIPSLPRAPHHTHHTASIHSQLTLSLCSSPTTTPSPSQRMTIAPYPGTLSPSHFMVYNN